jgi:biotin carboxylase
MIKKAGEMGLRTYVVSIPGDYPGIALSDVFLSIDTRDKISVLEAAKKHKVSAIVTTGTDVGVPTLGLIADELGLPGPSLAIAETVSNKNLFRRFQRQNGLRCPATLSFSVEQLDSPDVMHEIASRLRFPVIVKPADSSGSRGVSVVTKNCHDQIQDSLNLAISFTSTAVCIEEFLPGQDVGGDALVYGGKVVFAAITNKHMNGSVVRGHDCPSGASAEQQQIIAEVLQQHVTALGYRDGTLDFDIMLDSEGAWVIEMGLRLGGNGLTYLMEFSYGYDVVEDAILLALGKTPALTVKHAPPRRCGSYILGASIEGILEEVQSLSDLRRKCPWVLDLVLAKKKGSQVSPLSHNANQIGSVLFQIPERMNWQACTRELDKALKLKIASQSC